MLIGETHRFRFLLPLYLLDDSMVGRKSLNSFSHGSLLTTVFFLCSKLRIQLYQKFNWKQNSSHPSLWGFEELYLYEIRCANVILRWTTKIVTFYSKNDLMNRLFFFFYSFWSCIYFFWSGLFLNIRAC